MNKNTIYIYMMASMAMLVPFPGRLAYGIILVILLNLLMLSGTLFRRLVSLLSLDNLLSVLIAVLLVSEAVIFKQLLVLYSPLMALTLGFSLFLPAVSSFLIGSLYQPGAGQLYADILSNLKQSGLFSLYALFIFLVRDIFGYGTLSLPSRTGLVQLQVLPAKSGGIGMFWASVPGALLLCVLCIAGSALVHKKLLVAGEALAENGGDDALS
ncbi:MAG TPA: hypothetical protein DDW78_09945 [Treponema sp.]|nr:hypothetical protein [Treponema sp.]